MIYKANYLLGCTATVALLCSGVWAEGEGASADASASGKIDPALQEELTYVEALVDYGFPDFAEPVIAATKKKWPESDALFFAIEIRGMLSLGKFDEAEAKVASLPDRSGSKYWAARLEIANNLFARGKKTECSAIYDEFFKRYPSPPRELRDFYMQACYSYGQILRGDKRFAEAAQCYEGLLKQLSAKATEDDANAWCNVACETAEIYIHLADAAPANARAAHIASAKKHVDVLLWEQTRPVYFGRAIAMKAHLSLLEGRLDLAQGVIDDYMGQLADLHQQIQSFDPDGRKGLLRQSPMPQCRYLLADMMWKAAQEEFKKSKRNDDRIKALLFGDVQKNGKRNNAGAYNHALNVFIKYPESSWAAQAGDLSEEIAKFAADTYGAKIRTNISDKDREHVRTMQFRNAQEKYGEGDYAGAVADYLAALAHYPEGAESVAAIENIVNACLAQISRAGDDENKKASLRIDADAVEGYLSERFAGSRNRVVMTKAGDALLRVAALEKQRGELARADRLYKAFLRNYRRHVNAAITAAALAGDAQKKELYSDALALWREIDRHYTNSAFYATALWNISTCEEKLGNRSGAIDALNRYCATEKTVLRKTQGQMQLAMLYQKDGLGVIATAETNETPEAVAKQCAAGSAQIIRGIKQFRSFADTCDRELANPGVQPGEKKQYASLKESALYLIGDCWGRLNKPEDKLPMFRKQAIDNLEKYVELFPKGHFAKGAYVKLASYYTAQDDIENSKNSLDRLQKNFPDSEEAKNAKPRLAKSLIDMGFQKQGTEIYAEMLDLDGAYTPWQFVNAGEALIQARSWDLAERAFDRAISKAGTNQMGVVARARIGQARSLYAQKSYAEAREALDTFLADEKMSRMTIAADANWLLADVAAEQGRAEPDESIRKKHFGAAVGAIKKLHVYWNKRPLHEQDTIDLMAADIVTSRMEAEERMGLKEAAMDSCASAANAFVAFIQSRYPTAQHPITAFGAEELGNLERAYASLIPLYSKFARGSKLEDGRYDLVIKYAQQYLELFPNGKSLTTVQNCLNMAKSAGGDYKTPEAVDGAGDEGLDDFEENEGEPSAEPSAAPEEGDVTEAASADAVGNQVNETEQVETEGDK